LGGSYWFELLRLRSELRLFLKVAPLGAKGEGPMVQFFDHLAYLLVGFATVLHAAGFVVVQVLMLIKTILDEIKKFKS
jgi:hypothetical protein